RDGEIIDVEIMSVYVRQDNKEYSFAFVRDITERKRSETVLAESERKYRTLFETAEEGIWTIDAGFNTVSANRKMQDLFGCSEQEMLGRPVWDFVPPDEVESMKQALLIRQTGVPGRYERRWVRKDGTIIWCFTSATPLFSPDGIFIGSFGMFTDISERRRAETELHTAYEKITASEEELRQQYGELASAQADLQKNQQQLEDITGTVPGVVYQFFALHDGTMGLHYVSNRAEEILGISSDPGDFFERFTRQVDPRDREAFLDSVKAAVSSKSPWDFTGRFIKPGGETIWLQGISRPFVRKDETVFSGFLLDITGRKQAEDELNLLKISADRSSDEVFWLDFSGRILYANDAACRATGYSPGEFASMKIFELDPDFQPGVWQASVADLRERKNQFITTRHRRKDGSIMDVEIVAVYVSQDDKEYSFAYVRDITERKRTEEALFNSRQMLQLVLDTIPQRVFWKDRNSVYLGCNMPLARDAGYTNPADLIGKDDFDTASKATADLYRADDRQVMETGQPRLNFEEPQIKPDGSHAWLRTSKVPLRDRRGSIIGVLGTYEDITDLKHAEESLRENEEKYRTLVESSFDGIAIHQEGILVYVNRTAARILGADDPELFIGKSAIDIVAPAYRELIAKRVREAPESMQELIREQFLRLDGTPIDVDVTTKPSMWKGRPAAYVTFRDITAQLRAEEALRESEEKYRMLVEQSRDGVFIIQDGRLVFYNGALAGLTGYTAEELDGRLLSDLIAPEDRELVLSRARDRAEGRSVPDLYEISLLHKDGTGRTRVRVRAGLGTFRGRPASIGTFFDITEDRRREEALRESEEKYRTLVEVNRDIIYSLSIEGIILYASPQTITVLGYRPDELEGLNFSDLVHPDDVEELVRHIREHFDAGKPVRSDQFRVRRKDGTYRWFEDKTIYATDSRGKHIIAGTIRDITEEKAGQDALRESEEMFRALVETTSDFIWEVDATGKYTYVSPQVRHILGYEPDDLVGGTPFDIMPRDEAEKISAGFNHLVASRLPITGLENKAIRKDGSVVILETSGVVRNANDGSYLGYRGIDRDITMRKQAAERAGRISALKQDLLMTAPLEEKLKRIADGIVDIFGAD
ncbi:MAG: PAS domain S-box protein, partial [Methanoregula sp.]|nr:PAS domain S-box protein [Methanoregula sp.]